MTALILPAGAPVRRPGARKAGVRAAHAANGVAAARAVRPEEAGAAGASGHGRAARAIHAGLRSRP